MTSLQQQHATPVADPPSRESLGARLAAVSRQAQGLTATVDDPAVLAALRDLCGVPRPVTRADAAR